MTGFGCLSCDVEFVMEDGKLVELGSHVAEPALNGVVSAAIPP